MERGLVISEGQFFPVLLFVASHGNLQRKPTIGRRPRRTTRISYWPSDANRVAVRGAKTVPKAFSHSLAVL